MIMAGGAREHILSASWLARSDLPMVTWLRQRSAMHLAAACCEPDWRPEIPPTSSGLGGEGRLGATASHLVVRDGACDPGPRARLLPPPSAAACVQICGKVDQAGPQALLWTERLQRVHHCAAACARYLCGPQTWVALYEGRQSASKKTREACQ